MRNLYVVGKAEKGPAGSGALCVLMGLVEQGRWVPEERGEWVRVRGDHRNTGSWGFKEGPESTPASESGWRD